MDDLARRLGLRTNPTIFFTSAGLMVLILALLLLFPQPINTGFSSARDWVTTNLGWFFIFGVTTWLVFLIAIAFSRYGSLRLGTADDKPAYSRVSWFTMLFAGGIGTILMFWGVAEPINHFGAPPMDDVTPFSAEAAVEAMNISLYHLSLHTWAIFTLPGLAFGFFIYRYKLPMRVSSVFYPFLKDRIHGPIGKTIDVFAILGTLFGLAVSLGLGTNQIAAGLNALTGLSDNTLTLVSIVLVLTAVATISVAAGLDKGIKRLSNLNIGMAVGMMLFVLFAGGMTVFLLRQIFESLGNYLASLPSLALWNDSLAGMDGGEGWGWQAGWTVFYWAWTVTWAPFMGVFLARISRGRTVREFIGGVLLAPSLFTVIWFVIFGWSAMNIDGIGGDGGPLSFAVDPENGGPPIAMFVFFENFPLIEIMQGLTIIVVALFFATSADSAALVVDLLSHGEEEAGPVRQRVFWAVCLGLLAALLVALGGDTGITALQEVITVVGLPIFILVFAMIPALLIGLRAERRRIRRGDDTPPLEELERDPAEHPEDAEPEAPREDATR